MEASYGVLSPWLQHPGRPDKTLSPVCVWAPGGSAAEAQLCSGGSRSASAQAWGRAAEELLGKWLDPSQPGKLSLDTCCIKDLAMTMFFKVPV